MGSNVNIAELVFIPSPGLGHIMSTIEIAKVLVNRDQRLSVTILVIQPPGPSSGYFESLPKNTTMNCISFVPLPQNEEPPPTGDKKCPFASFSDFFKGQRKYVRNAVTDLVSRPGSGRLLGFVVDMFCTCMIDVANEFNVPTEVYFTSSAAFLGFKLFIQTLADDQNRDVSELSNSGTEVLVPGFVNPVPTKVFWILLRSREGVEFALSLARRLREVKAIMVNTFLELETHAIESLSADISIPPVYPVGPILSLERSSEKSLDDDVMTWLDGQPPDSVVLLCFGSMGCFDEVQVKEIAHALEQSGHRFVWSLRRAADETTKVPRDYEDPRVVLPEGFLERTDGIGKVIGWAPQAELLAHSAVGGFVSHCGWNSLLESLWFGVPVAAWAMYAEQHMNAFQMVVELGLAVEIKLDHITDFVIPELNTGVLGAKEIESGIRRVMEDTDVRKKVKEMSEKSRAAVAEGGSSYLAVGNFIQKFISNIS